MDWQPGKGYHFPDSPYVEYKGTFEDKEIQDKLNQVLNDLIVRDDRTMVEDRESE